MTQPLDYSEIRQLFGRLRAERPEPKGELEHTNAYTLLVAVALSAQATDKGVNRATRALFAAVSTPQEMLALGEERLIEHIRTIGLFRNKAKNVMRLSQILVDRFGGEVPCSREALASLPGVGRKTANVVLNMWWRFPAQAVDTHVFRVCNRTGLAPGKDVVAVERGIEDRVPADFALNAHHWLILHGRYTCLARSPRCWECAIVDLCRFEEKTPAPGSLEAKAAAKAKAAARKATKALPQALTGARPEEQPEEQPGAWPDTMPKARPEARPEEQPGARRGTMPDATLQTAAAAADSARPRTVPQTARRAVAEAAPDTVQRIARRRAAG